MINRNPKNLDLVDYIRQEYGEFLLVNEDLNKKNYPISDFLYDIRFACDFVEEYDLTKNKLEPYIEELEEYPAIKLIDWYGEYQNETYLNGHKTNDLWLKIDFDSKEALSSYTELGLFKVQLDGAKVKDDSLLIHNSSFRYYVENCVKPNKKFLENRFNKASLENNFNRDNIESILTDVDDVLGNCSPRDRIKELDAIQEYRTLDKDELVEYETLMSGKEF